MEEKIANKSKPNFNTQADIGTFGKLPPQALDLEEAILGSLMLDQDAVTAVIDLLKDDMFYKESHRRIFSSIRNLFTKSEPIDILTVTNQLKKQGDLDIVGGPYFIASLTNRVSSSANIEFHSRIIIEKYIQRELIRIANELIQSAYQDTADALRLLDKAGQDLFQIAENNFRRTHSEMKELVYVAIKEIDNAKNQAEGIRGIPSGFTQLDRITSGWQRSDLIILAARPGMGKTAFVLSMARNMAIQFNKPIAIFSLEMSALQLVTRLISAESQIPNDKIKSGKLEDYEWEQLTKRVEPLMKSTILIDDTPALPIFDLRAKCRRFKQQYDIQCIIIDYLQLMSAQMDDKDKGKGNREQEISIISRSLKTLAKELNVPVIALSQLNRGVETRTGSKRPQLADLRESGAIEQDADMVLFIYRPEYYQIDEFPDNTDTRGKAEIIIAKHRNGALGDVRLQFIDYLAKFENLPEENDGDYGYQLPTNTNFEQDTNSIIIPSIMNRDDDDSENVPF